MTRRIYHVPHGTPYHRENSPRGIKTARSLGFNAIDLDLQITKDGKVVGTHWGRPLKLDGFKDPLGRVNKDTPVRQMPWRTVHRLFALDHGRIYRIHGITALLIECERRGIEAVLEPKADPRFETDAPWRQIRAAQRYTGAKVSVRSIKNLGGFDAGLRRVQAARRNGFEAWVI